jgi:hypothetical protein
VLPPEFEQVFDVLDEAYGDPRRAEIPLDAELWVSAFLGGLWKAAMREDQDPELSEYGLVDVMEQVATPRTQAVLCGLASIGAPEVADLAGEASERLFKKGIRRPPWYGPSLQPVEYLEGWSVSDVFADSELLIAGFKRGKDRYAFTVTVANNAQGSVVEVLLIDHGDVPEILADLRAEVAEAEGVLSLDRLDAAELRRRLEPPVLETVVDDEDADDGFDADDDLFDAELHRALDADWADDVAAGLVEDGPGPLTGAPAASGSPAGADAAPGGDGTELFDPFGEDYEDDEDFDDDGDDFASLRYLLLSRLSILPEPTVLPEGADLGMDQSEIPALVAEFAASPDARDLPNQEIVREWAEVFIRLGIADFAGEPPLYGPEKFDMLINVLIPARINAKPAHLEALEPVAAAWAKWSTARVGLDGPMTDYLLEAVEDSFLDFEDSYGDPGFALDRQLFGYTLRSKRGPKGGPKGRGGKKA